MHLPKELAQRVIVIAGPTAVGKSALAFQLALRIGGEIVSVDSMQVYRGMDVGTAKPGEEERSRIPHHLLDVAGLSEDFDAAKFSDLAAEAVRSIVARNRVPILCGGSGLYFKGLLEGFTDRIGSDPALRAELERTPIEELRRRLESLDALALSRVDSKNPRRVIRALEIILLGGRKFWHERPESPAKNSPPNPLWIGLSRGRADLHQRIDARVDEMFRRGLVDETRRLLDRGLSGNRIALQALGYRQAAEHLAGYCSLAETIQRVKFRTHQYARRQMTWFRRQMRLTWHECEAGPDEAWLGRVLDQLEIAFRNSAATT